MQPELIADKAGLLRIWDYPRDGAAYVIGADIAEGRRYDRTPAMRKQLGSYVDQRPDYSVAIVLDLETGRHDATWRGYLSPDLFAAVCAAIGFLYNTALLVPEVNGIGLAVVTRLSETIRYPNIYRTKVFNVLDRDPLSPSLGWRTDQHTRKVLISRVHAALNSQRIFTRDQQLVSEMRTMEFDDMGVERARGNDKDDCVLALGMALQGRHEALGNLQETLQPKVTTDQFSEFAWNYVRRRQQDSDARRFSRGGRLPPSGSRSVMPRLHR